jgi:D-psicose/D-tagatose/L-ribulose 3-epimerase
LYNSSPGLGLIVDQAFYGSELVGRDAWQAAAEAGAKWFSIGFEALQVGAEHLAGLRDDAASVGVDIALVNCLAFSLNDPRDVVREFNLERVERHVDVVPELGARQLKILLGEWIWRTMWPDEDQWDALVGSMRKLAEYADRRGVELSLELEPLDTALINGVESLNRLLADVESPALLANVDTSHMAVRGMSATDIGRIKGRVNSVDFSDSNGIFHEHLPPGTGVANLPAYADELIAVIDENTLIAVEVGPFFKPETAYRKVNAAMVATAELFAKARSGTEGNGVRQ